MPSTFSELEALGTQDLAAAVTDEERYTQIVRDLMAASNVVQVGVWRQPLLHLHFVCGLHLCPELVKWSGLVCRTTAFSDLGRAHASQWHSAVNLPDMPGPICQGPLVEPGHISESRAMRGALLLVDSIWGNLLCSSAHPAQHAASGKQGALEPRLRACLSVCAGCNWHGCGATGGFVLNWPTL